MRGFHTTYACMKCVHTGKKAQLCWFQYSAGKNYNDFILSLMAFPYSNMCYSVVEVLKPLLAIIFPCTLELHTCINLMIWNWFRICMFFLFLWLHSKTLIPSVTKQYYDYTLGLDSDSVVLFFFFLITVGSVVTTVPVTAQSPYCRQLAMVTKLSLSSHGVVTVPLRWLMEQEIWCVEMIKLTGLELKTYVACKVRLVWHTCHVRIIK